MVIIVHKRMGDRLQSFNRMAGRILRSPRFFYVIILLLVLQAAWIAFTARYPQAFDENYHFGLIQLHAQQWIPFFTQQPDGPAVYGSIVREPSYLFHYLLSVPYRLLAEVTSTIAAQVIVLRFINIGIFVAGLFVYRRLFDELRISVALRNVVLAVFVLLPVVPLLAGQINYDNMMFLLSGLLFMYVARYIQFMRGRKPTAPLVSVKLLLQILLVGAIGSIVKFAFAPIFLAAVVILLIATIFYYNLTRIKPRSFAGIWAIPGRATLIVLSIATLLAVGLCIERYGVNLVQYQAAVPKCDKVLGVDACQAYSPWARDYLFSNTYPRPELQGYLVYPFVWVWRMVYETMFTITSRTFPPSEIVYYYSYSPLVVSHVAAWMALAGGLVGMAIFWRRIRRNRPLVVLLGIVVFYALVLFIQNFKMYDHSGEAVAIHGRYLVPVYPILLLCLGIGWHGILQWFKRGRYEVVVLIALTLLFMQGGGITHWLVRSDPDWYWESHTPSVQANEAVKSVVDRVILH